MGCGIANDIGRPNGTARPDNTARRNRSGSRPRDARTAPIRTPLLALATVLAAAMLLTACAGGSANQLVGTWATQLTGYNLNASSVTQYTQKVTFGDDGTVLLETTLPGGTDGQKGTYEVLKTDQGDTIRIVWDASPDTPLELGYSIQGNKLSTTRRQGTMPKPEQLNIKEVDPVVYVRQ